MCIKCGWISVKDRLPKKHQQVLFLYGELIMLGHLVNRMDLGWDIKYYCFVDDNNLSYEVKDVTHWMTLPEPPKD